jgi:hypothetical protein
MSELIGYDLDFHPKESADAGEPWEVMLWERFETGELRTVANGCGFDDFAALRDLIDRLTLNGSPNRMIAAVCEGYAARLREQMHWPPRRPAGSAVPSEPQMREPDPLEHRVKFITVALRERLILLPCACGADYETRLSVHTAAPIGTVPIAQASPA